MRRALVSAGLLGLLAASGGCYKTPKPACAFVCGPEGECPDGYACSSVDNICKRDDLAASYECENVMIVDASVSDAAVRDGSVQDGSVADGAVPDGAVPDGAVPDGAVPDGAPPDGASAVCGNGTPESPEACDDFNNDDCGSCNMGCSAVQTPTAATGSITTVPVSQLADGETFVIDDGFNSPVTFEFDSDGSATGTPIDISGISSGNQVRDAIVTAINNVGGTLEVSASNGGSSVVALTHDRLSSLGNQTITETVSASGFVVSGLSGGVAGDCPATTGCKIDDDCASGSCGVSVANECDP